MRKLQTSKSKIQRKFNNQYSREKMRRMGTHLFGLTGGRGGSQNIFTLNYLEKP
jgi:hypothetical protein